MLNWDEYEESSTAPKPQQKAQQPVTETVSEEPQSVSYTHLTLPTIYSV